MQRAGNKLKVNVLFSIILPMAIAILFIIIDQTVKTIFRVKYGMTGEYTVIKGFFSFAPTYNEGAAYGVLKGKAWAQDFFIALTSVALIMFFVFFYLIKPYNFVAKYGVALMISGTIGNFIDRVSMRKVVDMFKITVGGKDVFGVFNVADVCLCVGVALVVIHFLFIDEDALLRSKKSKEKYKAKIREKYYGNENE